MADYKAIVTGGAKGIGHGITSALLEAGGKVYMYKSRIYKFISCVILLIPSMVTRFP
jgi:short-subunit dehydrogenase involved in D-alanine esterification of teichoic acids